MRLTVDRLGHLGDGIAGDVFIPFALPGEVVEGAVSAGRMAEPEIMLPSPDRVQPECPHYRSCGGCSLMHASDRFLGGWKMDVVRKALAAQGLEAAFRPILTSPARSRRRATLSGKRTKKGAIVGFHGRSSDTISEISHCRLLHPELVSVIPVLKQMVVLGASRKARLALTITISEGGIDLAVSGGKEVDSSLFPQLSILCGQAGIARLTWNDTVLLSFRPAAHWFGRALVTPPPGAFLQATCDGEAALVGSVLEAVAEAGRVADLFAGSGTFSLPLAERAEVRAVEGQAEMLTALDAGWREARALHRIETECRDLFRRPLMPDELRRFDAIVIDPPRAGAEAQVSQIAAGCVPVVAMVSCNPVTFARDARILAHNGYVIDWIQVVDQFRWSPHVELVARLHRQFTAG
ncbi:MAG: class I SAM-dependent RNA methyltransferase [Rhodobacteraceae bacterium]|nr:class I SAM-dependent RNA methyltransferase [Paracoccaceae bacterium]MCP5341369.1 class I SAM-dependent RNA methyltransferase [Paracoccaceae bacterium]